MPCWAQTRVGRFDTDQSGQLICGFTPAVSPSVLNTHGGSVFADADRFVGFPVRDRRSNPRRAVGRNEVPILKISSFPLLARPGQAEYA
jgi:hypothetical protein